MKKDHKSKGYDTMTDRPLVITNHVGQARLWFHKPVAGTSMYH